MQITDMLNQYNRNIANGAEISGGTQGIRQTASLVQEMSVGNVFEGSISHMENGVVTLGLPDGKSIQARLDAGVSVKEGESMFFQVRSNNGAQIAIRPFSHEEGANPTLLNALKAANLQVNGKMITMIHAMMEQSMSIDKQSLAHMARLVSGHDGMDIASMVQMEKLGIPITEEMAAQFENYKSDQYAILDQLESVMEMLPEQLAGGGLSQDELLSFNRQMARVFLGMAEAAEDGKVLLNFAGQAAEGASADEEARTQAAEGAGSREAQEAEGAGNAKAQAAEGAGNAEGTQTPGAGSSAEGASAINAGEEMQAAEGAPADTGTKAQAGQGLDSAILAAGGEETEALLQAAGGEKAAAQLEKLEKNGILQEQADAAGERLLQAEGKAMEHSNPEELKHMLSDVEMRQMARQLSKVPELLRDPLLFSNGTLSENVTAKELLQSIERAFASKNPFSKQALSELVSSKEYRSLVRNVMEQQWLLRPEELKTEHKVNELYERLDRQLEQMEKVLKSFGQSSANLTDTAAGVRDNIQFMHQINQAYAYVQIPLKLAGQNAHSDLYVYTDKRKAREKDGELTAFLHLDLDHLGSTDVSVRLRQKKVSANFYLADDASYDLILEHMDLLVQRLEAKGYQAKVQVTNQEEKVNFVEDMLKQGAPSAGGMVHRYSFDVRA